MRDAQSVEWSLPGASQVIFASLKCRVEGSALPLRGPGKVFFVRFVWAVAAFVLAAVMIGAGIAQRTIFQGPRTETTAISVEEETPYLLIDGAVLNQMPGTQTLRAQAEGDIFAAYGRTADMEAWLSDTDVQRMSR